jgi:hypothetical protein
MLVKHAPDKSQPLHLSTCPKQATMLHEVPAKKNWGRRGDHESGGSVRIDRPAAEKIDSPGSVINPSNCHV